MITPFKAMSFKADDLITKEDVDQLQSNLQWLNDNTPRSRFIKESGRVLSTNAVLICGMVHIDKDAKESSATRSVTLGKAFSPDCNPNVTTGIVNDSNGRVYCVVNGPGDALLPNSSGFQISVTVVDDDPEDDWKIKKPFHVQWQAFGFRDSGMNDF